jgi:membrane protease YdiL (CAAX protease family)
MIIKQKDTIRTFLRENKRTLAVFYCAFLVLIANRYFSESDLLIGLFDGLGWKSMSRKARDLFFFSEHARFNSLLYWVATLDFFYLVIPALLIRFYLKEKPSVFGLNLRVEKGFFKYYFLFMLFMLVLVYWASTTSSFQHKYPFYQITSREQVWPRFIIWELVYCSQFFCLEFFFRGFMVKGLQPKFGMFSIFIMTVPYCMIHFGKPLPETIGSVFAGLILGYISYRGKGILPGFLMHITVALAMDGFALWQKGVF